MEIEKSCGAVLFTNTPDGRQYVLVKALDDGYCGFPKGHVENGETEEETALREIFEETCVDAEIIEGFRYEIEYSMPKGNSKQVVYFIAEYKHETPARNPSEQLDILTLPLHSALETLTYENTKQLLLNANIWLENTG